MISEKYTINNRELLIILIQLIPDITAYNLYYILLYYVSSEMLSTQFIISFKKVFCIVYIFLDSYSRNKNI